MILSTVPGMVVLGCSRVRAVSRFSSVILADLAMRGFAISFLTLARIARPDFVLRFFFGMYSSWHRGGSAAVQFHTVPKMYLTLVRCCQSIWFFGRCGLCV